MTCSWSEKRVSETTHKEDDDRETGDFYVHLGKFWDEMGDVDNVGGHVDVHSYT